MNGREQITPHSEATPTEEQPPSMPRWFKLLGIIAIVLVLLFLVAHLFGKADLRSMHQMHRN